jgi:hypothetical protein
MRKQLKQHRWWIAVAAAPELELRFQDNAFWAGRKPIKISPRRPPRLRLPYVPQDADILAKRNALQAYLQKAKLRRQIGRL